MQALVLNVGMVRTFSTIQSVWSDGKPDALLFPFTAQGKQDLKAFLEKHCSPIGNTSHESNSKYIDAEDWYEMLEEWDAQETALELSDHIEYQIGISILVVELP